jgi:hypothetical protein
MTSTIQAGAPVRLMLAVAAAIWLSGGIAASTTQNIQASADNVWQTVAQRPSARQPRIAVTGPSALLRLNKPALDLLLARAPAESDLSSANAVVFSMPMADGSFARFRVADSPILAPELAAAFPELRTYIGQGIDDPTATTRFGWTAAGFHAIVLSGSGTLYIDPYATGDIEYYVAVNKPDVQRPDDPFVCRLPGDDGNRGVDPGINALPISQGATLRTYRLALAATGEYTIAAGGTKEAALSRMVATINRVNGIYERELAVRFNLLTGPVADPTALIYTSPADPYSNDDGDAMLAENQANIDAVVGSANYNFGHVFSTGGGGVATLGSVCSAGTKARGVTGSPSPTGDGFDVDYVAHEMGHQFNGRHTFNSQSFSCGFGNRSAATAYEVGSGSTIQAYAGICDPENLQPNSDDYFTVESLSEMTAFITTGIGSTCDNPSATGNTIPTVSAGSSFTIPISTPFTLTASGSDSDGDTLTYDWEQYNLGTASTSVATASTDDGSRPIMRSYLPTTSPSRTFPKLTYVLNDANTPPQTYSCAIGTCLTGEILPTTSRTMTFHVTARDNRAGGGAIATASTTVTSSATAGPFLVTAPNTAVTVAGFSSLNVTWNVANTTAAPVSAANVTISLSTDGGMTFPTVLLASTPNDGSQSVSVPNTATSQARIKVQGAGNVFFDVSNANFTITASAAPPLVFEDDPLVTGVTAVKAVHINELRAAIDALRARYNLGAVVWTDSPIVVGTTPVQAVHVTEMRTALSAAYVAAGQPAPTFSPAVTAMTTVIGMAEIADLRDKVRALW